MLWKTISLNVNSCCILIVRRVWRYQRLILIRKSKKDRQHNGKTKQDKRTNNDLQKIHIKVSRTPHSQVPFSDFYIKAWLCINVWGRWTLIYLVMFQIYSIFESGSADWLNLVYLISCLDEGKGKVTRSPTSIIMGLNTRQVCSLI